VNKTMTVGPRAVQPTPALPAPEIKRIVLVIKCSVCQELLPHPNSRHSPCHSEDCDVFYVWAHGLQVLVNMGMVAVIEVHSI